MRQEKRRYRGGEQQLDRGGEGVKGGQRSEMSRKRKLIVRDAGKEGGVKRGRRERRENGMKKGGQWEESNVTEKKRKVKKLKQEVLERNKGGKKIKWKKETQHDVSQHDQD